MTDLMDQRLAAAGRQWRSEQASPPAIPSDRLDATIRGRMSWRPLVAAAAVVLLVAGGASVVSRLGDSGPTAPATAPSVSPSIHRVTVDHRAVPWRDLPATHPRYRKNPAGQAVTPYDRVSATGHISGHARPGDVLVFTAVLESSTDLPLDPCPDFNIEFGTKYGHTWQLDCTQVPYRDEQGRPVLPAFKKVRFEMRVTVPDEHGEQKVLWTLDGPQQMPGFYGIVRVD